MVTFRYSKLLFIPVLTLTLIVGYAISEWFSAIRLMDIPEERIVAACQMVLQLDSFLTAGFLAGFFRYGEGLTSSAKRSIGRAPRLEITLLGVTGIVGFAVSAFYAIAGVLGASKLYLISAIFTAIGGIITLSLVWLFLQDPLSALAQETKTGSLMASVPSKVFVDAKILGRHDPTLQKTTFVAYSVENSDLEGVREVVADETDEAELNAVLFAIQELKARFERFNVICDHESIVSEINRETGHGRETRPLLLQIREELKANPGIRVELLENNPAHRVLNRHIANAEKGVGKS